jgi:hypothetical protein
MGLIKPTAIPLGSFNYGVTRSPEGVKRRLQAAVTGAGKLVVGLVHRISRIEGKFRPVLSVFRAKC